jgi:hypothetical protein
MNNLFDETRQLIAIFATVDKNAKNNRRSSPFSI